ncbi:unnamed protein product [Effrenium voratum]|nr:unnamed protein product [Effrenium voratum]
MAHVGEGSFGAAILCQHDSEKDRDTKAIVKMIDISRASKQEKDDALKESKVLASLKHPYIVRYRESFHEDGWLCIVMDYCEGGDLAGKIKSARQSSKIFPQDQVVRWFTQAILALKYIHDLHILHRDLKSGNFFLSKSGNIKMGDFGIAKVLECTAACAQTQIGTPYYLSPEICQGKNYAWSSDIWSMGCILYEMCARKVPFDAPDLKSLIHRITKEPAPEIPSDYGVGVRNLGKELLDRDPGKRPPAAEILKRPVIQDMVRRMLDEVKDDSKGEEDKGEKVDKEKSEKEKADKPSPPSAVAGPYGSAAGKYSKGELVEYYSETHGEWLPATVTASNDDGRVQLNVKPGVWISLEIQGAKVRPRQAASAAPAPAANGKPPAGGSPSARAEKRDGRDGALQRNPSREAAARSQGLFGPVPHWTALDCALAAPGGIPVTTGAGAHRRAGQRVHLQLLECPLRGATVEDEELFSGVHVPVVCGLAPELRSLEAKVDGETQDDSIPMWQSAARDGPVPVWRHQQVQDAVLKFWDLCRKDETGIPAGEFHGIILRFLRIYLPGLSEEQEQRLCENSWQEACQGCGSLNFSIFFRAMVRLAQSWSDSNDPEDFAGLLQELLSRSTAFESTDLSGQVRREPPQHRVRFRAAQRGDDLGGGDGRDLAQNESMLPVASSLAALRH